MLRRLGGLGAAGGGADLRTGPGGNARFSVRDPDSFAGGGKRTGPGSKFAKETLHDYARNNPSSVGLGRPLGCYGRGRLAAAARADAGPGIGAGGAAGTKRSSTASTSRSSIAARGSRATEGPRGHGAGSRPGPERRARRPR